MLCSALHRIGKFGAVIAKNKTMFLSERIASSQIYYFYFFPDSINSEHV